MPGKTEGDFWESFHIDGFRLAHSNELILQLLYRPLEHLQLRIYSCQGLIILAPRGTPVPRFKLIRRGPGDPLEEKTGNCDENDKALYPFSCLFPNRNKLV